MEINLIIAILSVFAYMIPMLIFLPIEIKRWQKIILFIILFINILFTIAMGHIGIIVLMISVGIYLYLIDRKNIIRNMCIFVAGYILGVILDYTESMLWALVYDFYYIRDSTLLYAVFIIIHLILLTGLCILIKKIYQKIRYKFNMNFSREIWRSLSIILLSYLLIFIFNILASEKIGFSTPVLIINSLLFTGLFVVAIYQFIKAIKLYIRNHELELHQEYANIYTKQIEKMYDSHRSVTHDFYNKISLIGDYIKNKDMEAIEKYFDEYILPMKFELKRGDYKLKELINIELPKIKSMVTTKAAQATEKNIDVRIEIKKIIEKISMNDVDLSTVLSIFWDNAIEASIETENPQISFCIYQEEDMVTIILENNHINTGIEYYDIKSTKGGFHGIGLKNAHDILKKYKNVEHLPKIIDNIFTQRVEITNVENNNGDLVDEDDKTEDIDSKDQDS